MKIAIAASGRDSEARVPQEYETSPWLLIVETDTMQCDDRIAGPNPEAYLKAMLDYDCEALVCGEQIGQAAFDPIADANITRYVGTGLLPVQAVTGALYNRLPFLREYTGGPGCQPGGGCHAHA